MKNIRVRNERYSNLPLNVQGRKVYMTRGQEIDCQEDEQIAEHIKNGVLVVVEDKPKAASPIPPFVAKPTASAAKPQPNIDILVPSSEDDVEVEVVEIEAPKEAPKEDPKKKTSRKTSSK